MSPYFPALSGNSGTGAAANSNSGMMVVFNDAAGGGLPSFRSGFPGGLGGKGSRNIMAFGNGNGGNMVNPQSGGMSGISVGMGEGFNGFNNNNNNNNMDATSNGLFNAMSMSNGFNVPSGKGSILGANFNAGMGASTANMMAAINTANANAAMNTNAMNAVKSNMMDAMNAANANAVMNANAANAASTDIMASMNAANANANRMAAFDAANANVANAEMMAAINAANTNAANAAGMRMSTDNSLASMKMLNMNLNGAGNAGLFTDLTNINNNNINNNGFSNNNINNNNNNNGFGNTNLASLGLGMDTNANAAGASNGFGGSNFGMGGATLKGSDAGKLLSIVFAGVLDFITYIIIICK
ncbi:hypothetical protein DPMN_008460 [Dreissena polymorpha]|uniref:Uncharacterized protein n=1 Tax=Dreissena polymorpha TaxID=45954 RepID=A0A9D4MW64_DREPO|nr:hypothetical protein DPMN_008460 [Dreissena polymorpha]